METMHGGKRSEITTRVMGSITTQDPNGVRDLFRCSGTPWHPGPHTHLGVLIQDPGVQIQDPGSRSALL